MMYILQQQNKIKILSKTNLLKNCKCTNKIPDVWTITFVTLGQESMIVMWYGTSDKGEWVSLLITDRTVRV